jgi:hypothetical protein
MHRARCWQEKDKPLRIEGSFNAAEADGQFADDHLVTNLQSPFFLPRCGDQFADEMTFNFSARIFWV